jgi:hypothetical protein
VRKDAVVREPIIASLTAPYAMVFSFLQNFLHITPLPVEGVKNFSGPTAVKLQFRFPTKN